MKKKLFGAVVAPISILGLTFALGLGTTAFAVGEQKQDQEDSVISTLDVTTEIPVAPWCGWYVSGAGDGDLVLEPDEGAPTSYIGTEIALTATADQNTAYVGPSSGQTSQGSTEDCSWFTEENKYGARYDVVASGDAFTATALLAGGATADEGMNFSADVSNPLNITNVGIAACANQGFMTNDTASLKTGALTTTPWSVVTADVTNTNFCQWSAKYEIKIPLGMSPLYGNVSYGWAGTTFTHTIVIPEPQPS